MNGGRDSVLNEKDVQCGLCSRMQTIFLNSGKGTVLSAKSSPMQQIKIHAENAANFLQWWRHCT